MLESKQANEVVVRDNIHELTKDDLQRLRMLQMLNGDVISFYLHILCDAVNALEGVDVHIMPTTFFSLLVKRGKTKNGEWTCNFAGVKMVTLFARVVSETRPVSHPRAWQSLGSHQCPQTNWELRHLQSLFLGQYDNQRRLV